MHTNQAEYSATENFMGEDMTNNNDTHEMQRAPAVDQAQRRSNAYFGTAIAAVGLAAAIALGFKTGDWWISAVLFAAVLVALRVESDLRNRQQRRISRTIGARRDRNRVSPRRSLRDAQWMADRRILRRVCRRFLASPAQPIAH